MIDAIESLAYVQFGAEEIKTPSEGTLHCHANEKGNLHCLPARLETDDIGRKPYLNHVM